MLVFRKKKPSKQKDNEVNILNTIGEETTQYVLDPLTDNLEKIENLPGIKEVNPKSISRFKIASKGLSRFVKSYFHSNNQKSTKSRFK